MSELEVDDIQGIIISGYSHLYFSRYLFFQVTNLVHAKEWLEKIIPRITTANWGTAVPRIAINIAFTGLGLKKFGLSSETLSTFPAELIEGMAEVKRSTLLQDQGKNAPLHWEPQYQNRMGEYDCFCGRVLGENCSCRELPECHLLIILQARSEEERQEEFNKLMDSIAGVKQLFYEDGYLSYFKSGDPRNHKDHFGFHDSISQPEIEGSPALTKKLMKQPFLQQDVIKAGEFILGYLNQDNRLPETPNVVALDDNHNKLKPVANYPAKRDLGRNGSYLVFRKLKQNVADFRNYIANVYPDDEAKQKQTAAKLIGRWQSGAPLSLNAEFDPGEDWYKTHSEDYQPENRFHYRSTDPDGLRCPLGAHIRRANPRDSLGKDPQSSIATANRHRILRRGVLYGKLLPDGQEDDDRGILFICINANIKRQFEFVQTLWMNNPRFSNLDGETDPIVGSSATQIDGGSYSIPETPEHEAKRKFTIQRQPVRQRLQNLPDFVTLRGGGYFFLPSISTLHFLTTLRLDRDQSVTDAPKASNESC